MMLCRRRPEGRGPWVCGCMQCRQRKPGVHRWLRRRIKKIDRRAWKRSLRDL